MKPHRNLDSNLWSRAQNRSPQELEHLLQNTTPQLVGFVHSLLGKNMPLVFDKIQSAYQKVFSPNYSVDLEKGFLIYILREIWGTLEKTAEKKEVVPSVEMTADRLKTFKALQLLEGRQRALLLLRWQMRFTFEEMAWLLKSPPKDAYEWFLSAEKKFHEKVKQVTL